VELVVAAVLVLVAVVAVVAVVRKSTDMQVNDYHRRQARAAIMSHFETSFSFRRFSNPSDGSNPRYTTRVVNENGDTVLVEIHIPMVDPVDGFTAPVSFVLNDRKGGVAGKVEALPLLGYISFRAVSEPQTITLGGQTHSVDAHNITARVWWYEVGGVFGGLRDTVVLTKRLANAL
jgi:hypothetical protein